MKKVIIWGHKLHTHTHSYIHAGFYKAFQSLGFDTYWFDDNDNIDLNFFSDSIILTETQVDNKLPVCFNCKYILHNCNKEKYKDTKHVNIQVYTNGKENSVGISGTKINNYTYYDTDKNILYQPWATNLLPTEITQTYNTNTNKSVKWIGTVGGGYHGNIEEVNLFFNTAKSNGYTVQSTSGYLTEIITCEEQQKIIFNSEIAPTLVGKWQQVNDYLPCRLFKNISYGKLLITNSPFSWKILEENGVFDYDCDILFEKYQSLGDRQKQKYFKNSINIVKKEHTYINRIEQILQILC